jgi:glycosyltransferase 2 family protein
MRIASDKQQSSSIGEGRRLMLWIKKTIGPILGLVIFVYFLLRVNYSVLGDSWRHIHLLTLLLACGLGQLSMAMRAVRWRFLLLSTRPIPLRKLVSAVSVGSAASWILPFRLGEMAGAYSLQQLEPVRFSTLMASVVADRLLDVLWLASALIFVLVRFPLPAIHLPSRLFGANLEITRENLVLSAKILTLIFMGGLIFLVVLFFRLRLVINLVRRTVKPFSAGVASRLEHLCITFAEGLHVLRNPSHCVMAIVTTLVIWSLGQVAVYTLIASFPFPFKPTAGLSLIVLTSVAAGLTMPNAPGYVGTIHAAIVIGLLMGNPTIDFDQALSFAIIYHLCVFIPVMLLGIFFMWLDDLRLIPKKPQRDNRNSS